jgi:hypothetical protein
MALHLLERLTKLLSDQNPHFPTNFSLGKAYIYIRETGIKHLTPWEFVSDSEFKDKYVGIRNRFPLKNYIPFAFRSDSDDVAVWMQGNDSQKVFIIHDYCDDGFEMRKEYKNIWEWLRGAVDEMIDFAQAEIKFG